MTTTSRHRSNIVTLFDVFTEIAGVSATSTTSNGSPSPLILQKYPEDFNDESILKSIRQFAFPLGISPEDPGDLAVQLFSFVLTDSNSQLTFGYCRYTPRTNSVICLLSGYAWTSVFYKLLNHISIVMNNGTQDDVDLLLTRVYHTDAPSAGEHLRLETIGQSLDVEIPDLTRLPTLKDDKYMLEFYNAVTPRQMMSIYASLLRERRIIFVGSKLGQLSSCVYATATLLYPMAWQSLFIPVLPSSLLDMIMAPMPFIIGVPKQINDPTTLKDIGDVMVIDLDERSLQGAHDDFATLPNEVQSSLKSSLKAGVDMGDALARIFLRANLILFGGYRTGLTRSENTQVVAWDKDRFISEQRPSLQAFLSSLFGAEGVQYLERFIDERLRALNAGAPINDEFEKEANQMDSKRSQLASQGDVFEQAFSAVRENATDVIGALKDKVRSIEIRDRIGRLTPKEMRRGNKERKRSKSVKREEPPPGVEPLSFENIQWRTEHDTHSSSPSVASSNHESTSFDLIDFGDTPTSERPKTIVGEGSHRPDDFSDLIAAPSSMASLLSSSEPRLKMVGQQDPIRARTGIYPVLPVNGQMPPPVPLNPFLVIAPPPPPPPSNGLYSNPFCNAGPVAPSATSLPPRNGNSTTHKWERFD
ncbi:hypothetical protein PENTCL1PPCAC_27905 [Pristionchus entomophagus]|uniref:UDENN domain-containing protein n=1 Tax=Pristionchus entomophagus TaxID=358040 RepID=A0AAV5UFJ3_9BILA|nr:hypothetical protein PENTCL1PPCAC_27905 [Pristionchus entomophagus]